MPRSFLRILYESSQAEQHAIAVTVVKKVQPAAPTAWQGCMYHEQVCDDAAEKLEQAESQLSHSGRTGRFGAPMDRRPNANDNQLLKICRDSSKMSVEQVKGISSQVSACCHVCCGDSHVSCGGSLARILCLNHVLCLPCHMSTVCSLLLALALCPAVLHACCL